MRDMHKTPVTDDLERLESHYHMCNDSSTSKPITTPPGDHGADEASRVGQIKAGVQRYLDEGTPVPYTEPPADRAVIVTDGMVEVVEAVRDVFVQAGFLLDATWHRPVLHDAIECALRAAERGEGEK